MFSCQTLEYIPPVRSESFHRPTSCQNVLFCMDAFQREGMD